MKQKVMFYGTLIGVPLLALYLINKFLPSVGTKITTGI